MSKQELRDEMKEMEGDPVMRQRRREAHRKVAQARELRQVKTADVIITNPTEIAVALKYDPEKMPAPIVVAKGMGEIAASIRRIAAENRIPIIERKEVARSLYRTVKVGHADSRRDVSGLRRDHGLRLPDHRQNTARPLRRLSCRFRRLRPDATFLNTPSCQSRRCALPGDGPLDFLLGACFLPLVATCVPVL